jgi:hypothetical protein
MPSTNILGKVEIAHADIAKEVKNHQIALEFAKIVVSNTENSDGLQKQFNLFKDAYDLAIETLNLSNPDNSPQKK